MAPDGKCILVVEDNPDVRKVVVTQLNQLGYRILEAETGEAALTILNSDAAIDLVFSDMVMPGEINGAQLAALACDLRPGVKVMLTSGFARGTVAGNEEIPPDVEFLSKPYRRAELAEKLRSVLELES